MGPFLGALLASGFWYLIESLGWKTVNPGQDYDDLETQLINPKLETLRPNVYVSRRDREGSNATASPGFSLNHHSVGEAVRQHDDNGNDNSDHYYQHASSDEHPGPVTGAASYQGKYTNGQDNEK